MSDLNVQESPIPGLFIVNLPLHEDDRGWFKENYQKEKMEALGLPSFNIVQNNFSFNRDKGIVRGLHAEPWEKYISVANGSVFGAWVDLRAGESFGRIYTHTITPDTAIFVPRGVANSYQTLEENITYTYLVNEHWSPAAKYVAVNIDDSTLGITWPISIEESIVSDKDKANPFLADVQPMETESE